MEDKSPIIFYYLTGYTDEIGFSRILKRRFRESGHDREIEFRFWDCYESEPGRDGDLFAYDGVVMTTLVNRGFLHQLPEIIDVSNVFAWVHDCSKVRKRLYGIPYMLCGCFLICRKKDYVPIRNIYDVNEEICTSLRESVLPYLEMIAFCNGQSGTKSVETMKYLNRILGGSQGYVTESRKDNIKRFINKECKYMLSFSEHIQYLPPDEYVVQLVNFSDSPVNEMPMLFADYVSMGANVTGEKLLDCLDILEIISDSDFLYEFCTVGGKRQYTLSADRTVYPGLIAQDPVYESMLRAVKNPNNCILRYGKDFYLHFHEKEESLFRRLKGESS